MTKDFEDIAGRASQRQSQKCVETRDSKTQESVPIVEPIALQVGSMRL